MKPIRHATPSGLPARDFQDRGARSGLPAPRGNGLATILDGGVWFAPEEVDAPSELADSIVDSDWPVPAEAQWSAWIAALVWWESRRLLFNALLLTAAIPAALLLLLIAWIRATFEVMTAGQCADSHPVGLTALMAALLILNLGYAALSWVDALLRGGGSGARHLGMWQSITIFGIAAVALCFAASAAYALGAQ